MNSLKAQDSFSFEAHETYLSPHLDRIVIGQAKIKNPVSFGLSDGLIFSKIEIDFKSPIRWKGRWNIKRAHFTIERLNIVKKASGDNLDELGILIKAWDAPKKPIHPFLADEVNIILREIAFIDPNSLDKATVAQVNLQITDHYLDSYTKIYDSLMKLIAAIGKL
ncbi:MAG: hypothetical protein NZM04_03650 [Methylacidiphilales bacterium]|nr:hypothetical protein [Candidatus Methylacidiphilales bacterium]MDW8348777.1 hypothetical protein [Verrucomicrobiae bacterium]